MSLAKQIMQIKIISLTIQNQDTNYYTCAGGTFGLYCVFEQYYYIMNFGLYSCLNGQI